MSEDKFKFEPLCECGHRVRRHTTVGCIENKIWDGIGVVPCTCKKTPAQANDTAFTRLKKWKNIGDEPIRKGDPVFIGKDDEGNITVRKAAVVREANGLSVIDAAPRGEDFVSDRITRYAVPFIASPCGYPGVISPASEGFVGGPDKEDYLKPDDYDPALRIAMESLGINPGVVEPERRSNFRRIGDDMGKLVEEKNAAYGDAFAKAGEILKVLFPNGIQPDQYTDVLAILRILDKFFRIATRKDAFGESPWKDILGYAILGVANDEKTGS